MKRGFRQFASRLLKPSSQPPPSEAPGSGVPFEGDIPRLERTADEAEIDQKLKDMALGLMDPEVEGAIVLRLVKQDEPGEDGQPQGALEAQCSLSVDHVSVYCEAIRRLADAIEADAATW